MKIQPRTVFGGLWGASPSPTLGTGGYKYQPGTILTVLNPAPTVPTFGSSFSPPAVPTIGSLWGAAPPTSSGVPYTPNLSSNTGFSNTVTPQPIQAGNTGGSGFFTSLSSGLFK